jgi:drug/metabolite transporter (DMT)-like permease
MLAIGSSVALMAWHIRSIRHSDSAQLEPAELGFRRRQFRRRMQASAMLGLLGVALIAAPSISHRDRPLAFVAYWGAVLGWIGWIVLLALGDAWLSQQHLRRQARAELDRIAGDREKLARIQRTQANGRHRDSH